MRAKGAIVKGNESAHGATRTSSNRLARRIFSVGVFQQPQQIPPAIRTDCRAIYEPVCRENVGQSEPVREGLHPCEALRVFGKWAVPVIESAAMNITPLTNRQKEIPRRLEELHEAQIPFLKAMSLEAANARPMPKRYAHCMMSLYAQCVPRDRQNPIAQSSLSVLTILGPESREMQIEVRS